MVRFYDPSRTDPSLLFIRGVQNYVSESRNKLSDDEIKGAIKAFLKEEHYKKMINEYIDKKADFPDLIIRDNCPKKRTIMSPYMDYTYYKSYYDKATNKICICSNFLTDLLDLKENFDRELTMAYDHNIRNKNLEDNEMFACSQIRACRKQYDNFYQINDELKKNLTSTCAKYLMKVIIFLYNTYIYRIEAQIQIKCHLMFG